MWIKKHWNDPITVGGYTKLCIWSFTVYCAAVIGYVVYYALVWTDLGDKIKSVWSNLVHKIKRDNNSQGTES